MKRPLLTMAAALSFCALNAQEDFTPQHRSCGTMEHQAMLEQQDPTIKQVREEIERNIQDYVSYFRTNPDNSLTAVVTIPTVFHVVWNTTAESLNVSRLNDQLAVLNADYRKLNTDWNLTPSVWQGLVADCEVQFCLAQRTPTGASTTGITYTQTTVTSFSTNNAVKYTANGGKDIWDRNKYLNVWVCDLSGGLLGYAQFPGGPAATDGVVIDYQYTGTTGASPPFNKGRTATHEVGHWLNLYHIWGDDNGACSGSDQVSDTPNAANYQFGCFSPSQVVTDACTTTSPGIMWMNYMDYTDDACMYMFTTGQKSRVTAIMNGTRVSLQTSNGCTPTSAGVDEYTAFAVNLIPNPSAGQFIVASPAYDLNDCEVKVFDALGNLIKSFHHTNGPEIKVDIRGVSEGIYFLQLDNGTGQITKRLVVSGQ
ncbi:MAG: T9SS type A sorting domain-containing protein [Bacteroidia bacterium]|nr:T9SS type A sorting domain-containing protein [Bacteroidia bacterium]